MKLARKCEERVSRLRCVPNPKAIRLAMGLTQEALARRFEIAVGTLRDWEQGDTCSIARPRRIYR